MHGRDSRRSHTVVAAVLLVLTGTWETRGAELLGPSPIVLPLEGGGLLFFPTGGFSLTTRPVVGDVTAEEAGEFRRHRSAQLQRHEIDRTEEKGDKVGERVVAVEGREKREAGSLARSNLENRGLAFERLREWHETPPSHLPLKSGDS